MKKKISLAEELAFGVKDTPVIKIFKEDFYGLMKKHGIKVRPPNGSMNPLWTVYQDAYIKRVMDSVTYEMVMDSLKAYYGVDGGKGMNKMYIVFIKGSGCMGTTSEGCGQPVARSVAVSCLLGLTRP